MCSFNYSMECQQIYKKNAFLKKFINSARLIYSCHVIFFLKTLVPLNKYLSIMGSHIISSNDQIKLNLKETSCNNSYDDLSKE